MNLRVLVAGVSAALALGSLAKANTVSFSGVLEDVVNGGTTYRDGQGFSLTFSYDPAALTSTPQFAPHFIVTQLTGPVFVDFEGPKSIMYTDADASILESSGGIPGLDVSTGSAYSVNSGSSNIFFITEVLAPTVFHLLDEINSGMLIDGAASAKLEGYSGPAAPEPSTWALMLVGIAGVGLALRQRVRAFPSASPYLPLVQAPR